MLHITRWISQGLDLLEHITGFSRQFIKFLFVGVLNTAFAYVMYAAFLFVGCHYALAALLSNILGILFNFKTIGGLVFGNKNNRLIFKFFGVYAVGYLANVGGLTLLNAAGLSNMYAAGLILTLPVALLTFWLNKTFVFNAP